MLKKIGVLVCVFIFSFTQITLSQINEPSFEVTLPSGKVVKMTKSQLEELITKPGMGFANVAPSPALPKDQIAIPLPSELGGGYIIGTPEAIAKGMNAVNITVGATADFVVKSDRRTATILIVLAVVGGIAAFALGSGGGGGGGGAAPPSH